MPPINKASSSRNRRASDPAAPPGGPARSRGPSPSGQAVAGALADLPVRRHGPAAADTNTSITTTAAPRGATLPARPDAGARNASDAPANSQASLDQSLAYLRTFDTLNQRLDTRTTTPAKIAQVARLGFDAAEKGLATLKALPATTRLQRDDDRRFLMKQQQISALTLSRATALATNPNASLFIERYAALISEADTRPDLPAALRQFQDDSTVAIESCRAGERALQDCARVARDQLAEVRPRHHLDLDLEQRMSIAEQTMALVPTVDRMLKWQRYSLTEHRLGAQLGLSPELKVALAEHETNTNPSIEGLKNLLVKLRARRATPDDVAWLQNTREQLLRSGERLCLLAAQEIDAQSMPDATRQWEQLLELADGMRDFAEAISKVLDEPNFRPEAATSAPRPEADPHAAALAALALDDAGPSRTAETSPAPASRAQRRRRAAARSASATESVGTAPGTSAGTATGTTATAAATAPASQQAMILAQVHTRLRAQPLDAALAAAHDHDIEAIGAALDRNIPGVAGQRDPVPVAKALHAAARTWFGDIERWRMVGKRLGAMPGHDAQELAAHIADRVDTQQRILDRIDRTEGECIKQHEIPKATHVLRLLELDAVARVDTPVRLRSEDDRGTRHGTLFEIAVRPTALADGTAAAPLYVHLHAREPIDAHDCLTLPIGRFSAVHVKTAAQKNLGAKWEQIQHALGNPGAIVHRDPIGPNLLEKLRGMSASTART